MATSLFGDKAHVPEEHEVREGLGPAAALWNLLKERTAAAYPPLTEEWTYSGKPYGWSLRLKCKKRAVLYMTPCSGYFRVGLALGEKAAFSPAAAELPEEGRRLIEEAPKYPEGRGIRLEIHGMEDIDLVERLAAIKMAH